MSDCAFKILLLLLGLSYGTASAFFPPGTYFQEVKNNIVLPPKAEKNVLKLLPGKQGEVIAVTSNGIFKYHNNEWSGEPFGSGWVTAASDPQGDIWLASDTIIQKENSEKQLTLPLNLKVDTIQSLLWQDSKVLLVATNNGLLSYDGNWKIITATRGKHIYGITKDARGDLWVATHDGLLYRKNEKWVNLDDNLMANANRRRYFSVASTNNGTDILYGGILSVGCIAGNGSHWMARGPDGLPYGPVNIIKAIGSTIWYGTDKGAIKKDEKWHYYHGKRWLPDNHINDILPLNPKTVWIATPDGISEIRQIKMTLEEKAEAFEERIQKRHKRHGLVARSKLAVAGDLTSNQVAYTFNDGLWTSIYLAAESFRYAVTKDPVAKKNAENAFEAMERLEQVTGIPGFPARTLASPGEKVGAKGDWRYSPDKKWKWLGDTSSDEMIGHFFAYPLFHELVASNTQKKRVESLVSRILDHILHNNYQMVDLNEKPTRWGIWNPDSLNRSTNWWYEKGTNSSQILSFLQAGYALTGHPRFAEAARYLVQKEGYAENMVQAKQYGPFEINYVDNQLSYFPYYILGRYSLEPVIKPYLEKSLKRSWEVVKKDKTPMWNIIASTVLKEDCDLETARTELEAIPMDMVMWSMKNSHRWDLIEDPLSDRMGKRQGIKPIPVAERGVTKWNINPYQLDSEGKGEEENDGAYFLLAYWMGRFHGYWN